MEISQNKGWLLMNVLQSSDSMSVWNRTQKGRVDWEMKASEMKNKHVRVIRLITRMVKTLLMGNYCPSGIFKECLKMLIMFRMELWRTSWCILYHILLASYYIHNVKQCVIFNDIHLKGYIEKTHTVHRIFAKMCTIQQSLLWGVLLPCSLLDMPFHLQCDEWAGSNISLFLDSSFSFILSAKVRAAWIFFSSGIENEFNNCLYTWVTASSRLIQLVRYYSISL